VNIYYSPEKFGLETVGEIDFSSGCYEFDLTVAWKDSGTGKLFYAQDSGCSCPSPFEDLGRDGLMQISRLQDLIDHLEARVEDKKGELSEVGNNELQGKVAELIQKVRAA
jgi:hypothetical protein